MPASQSLHSTAALAVGPYRNWKQTVVALLAMVTAVLVPITNK